MSYPPNPSNPYGGQPGYGYPQQPGVPPQAPGPGQQPGMPPQAPGMPQPGYGYPQQPGVPPQAPQGMPPQGYGYPQQGMAPQGYGYPGGGYQQPGMMPPFAGWGSRVGAALLDGLIVGVAPMLFFVIAATAFVTQPSYDATTGSYEPGGLETAGVVLYLLGMLVMAGLGLWILHQEGTTGQTPGKKALNIAVLREVDGRPLGFGMAFVRKLCHILDNMACYLGWFWPLWDAKKQTFADKIISSVVVRTR